MDNLTNSIDQVVEENSLPHEWSKEVLAELKDLGVKNNKRDDLRKIPFVTMMAKMPRILMMQCFAKPIKMVLFFK